MTHDRFPTVAGSGRSVPQESQGHNQENNEDEQFRGRDSNPDLPYSETVVPTSAPRLTLTSSLPVFSAQRCDLEGVKFGVMSAGQIGPGSVAG